MKNSHRRDWMMIHFWGRERMRKNRTIADEINVDPNSIVFVYNFVKVFSICAIFLDPGNLLDLIRKLWPLQEGTRLAYLSMGITDKLSHSLTLPSEDQVKFKSLDSQEPPRIHRITVAVCSIKLCIFKRVPSTHVRFQVKQANSEALIVNAPALNLHHIVCCWLPVHLSPQSLVRMMILRYLSHSRGPESSEACHGSRQRTLRNSQVQE